jgi:DNA-binding NarL/FixJ family response regulator
MSNLRILLVDDNPIVRKGQRSLIDEQPDMEVVGETGDGQTALQLAKELLPNVMVVDFSLPDLNGAQITERIKQAYPQVQTLALTIHEESSYFRHMFQAGAKGYLLKQAADGELIQAIRVVAAGRAYLDPTLAGKMAFTLVRPLNPNGIEKAQTNKLSGREQEVLRLIALGYSNKEIAAQLDLSPKTVETYKARLVEKLNLRSRVELVRYALDQGWLQSS